MGICSKCGGRLEPGESFCGACGQRLGAGPAGGQGRRPGAYSAGRAPAEGPSFLKVFLITTVVVVILAGGGYLGWRYGWPLISGEKQVSKTVSEQKPAASTPSVSTGSGAASSASAGESAAKPASVAYSKPETFLPQTGQKYQYTCIYEDGDKASVEYVVSKVNPKAVLSEVEFSSSEMYKETVTFARHYLARADGVYLIADEGNYTAEPWLKNGLKTGEKWVADGIEVKVKETGATCDLGFMRFENCVVLEKAYHAGYDHVNLCYLAPGYGEVMVKEVDGPITKKLVKVTPIDGKTAEDTVKTNSPNLKNW